MACTTVCSPVNIQIHHSEPGYTPSCSGNLSTEISSAFSGLAIGKIITANDYNKMKTITTTTMINRGYPSFTFPAVVTNNLIIAEAGSSIVGKISSLNYFSGYFGTNFTPGEIITLSKVRKLETFLKTFADGCHCVQDIQQTDDGDVCTCNY